MPMKISAPVAARVLLGAALLALAAGASAQRVYRSVGPDGKPVFSDRPPLDSEAVELRSGRASAPATPAPDAAAPAALPGLGSPITPEALTRSLRVMVNLDSLVNGFEEICKSTLPSSMTKYHYAAMSWRQRHLQLLSRRDLILEDALTPAQRRQVTEAGEAEARKILDPVYKNPVDRRIKWCDTTASEIKAGALDRSKDPVVYGPLYGYQLKNRKPPSAQ